MKHRQNQDLILLPDGNFETLETLEAFQVSTTQTIELQINEELLKAIRTKSDQDEGIREIRKKIANGITRDGKIALGLCEEKNGLLTYDGLIWTPDNDELRIRILRDHHDAQAAGHPGRARTLELISRSFYWPGLPENDGNNALLSKS